MGNVQSCVSSPLVVGDELYFYFNGRPQPAPDAPTWDADFTTGLAILRRDGFASMDASPSPKTLTTRPVSFSGKYLFVNVDCPSGELKVEVLIWIRLSRTGAASTWWTSPTSSATGSKQIATDT